VIEIERVVRESANRSIINVSAASISDRSSRSASRSDFRPLARPALCIVNSHVRVMSRVCVRNEFTELARARKLRADGARQVHLHPRVRERSILAAFPSEPTYSSGANGSALNPSRPRTFVTSNSGPTSTRCSSRFSPRRQRLPDHPDSVSPVLLIRVSASSASGSYQKR
jgi:hypothetical protein